MAGRFCFQGQNRNVNLGQTPIGFWCLNPQNGITLWILTCKYIVLIQFQSYWFHLYQ